MTIRSPDFVSDCGRVILYLGDCIQILPQIQADAVITDPPYGHGYVAAAGGVNTGKKWEGGDKWKRHGFDKIEGHDKPFDPAPILELNLPTVLWGANHYASRLPDSSAWLVWDKRRGTTENNFSDCELAWCNVGGVSRLRSHLWNGLCRDSEVGEHIHPTQKPIVIMAWCMEKAKVPIGATVLDPYMGSGSTIIAAIRTGRKAIGIEIDKFHFQNALERIKRELQQTELFISKVN